MRQFYETYRDQEFVAALLTQLPWTHTCPEQKREFAVEPQNLEERLSVQDIETREMVTDPLNAAPELPFGHMNAGWKEFLAEHNTNDELWSFSAVWQSDWDLAWGFKKLRSGYVIVKDGTPGIYILTTLKDLTGEVTADSNARHAPTHFIPRWLRKQAD